MDYKCFIAFRALKKKMVSIIFYSPPFYEILHSFFRSYTGICTAITITVHLDQMRLKKFSMQNIRIGNYLQIRILQTLNNLKVHFAGRNCDPFSPLATPLKLNSMACAAYSPKEKLVMYLYFMPVKYIAILTFSIQ